MLFLKIFNSTRLLNIVFGNNNIKILSYYFQTFFIINFNNDSINLINDSINLIKYFF